MQQYLAGLAEKCEHTARATAGRTVPDRADTAGMVMFPVALDNTAVNLPASISRRNFIRHHQLSGAEAHRATEETLKHLTEALSRDLNGRLFPTQMGAKLKLFISYARADGTETPKRIPILFRAALSAPRSSMRTILAMAPVWRGLRR